MFLSKAQTYELLGKDTINYTDAQGKKQGLWIVLGKHKPGTCHAPTQKVEEGKYVLNRKTGIWMEYYCNGQAKNKITFVNGRPDGYAITYHENGKINEEGNWKNNRWVGEYKMYYENGNVQHDFVFNNGGKREGVQTYNYENGNIALQGTFTDGKETGVFKEYYENGELKAEKTYNDGNVDLESIVEYDAKKPIKPSAVEPKIVGKEAIVTKEEKVNEATAVKNPNILNGKHTLYNGNKQITKDGIFKDNRLMDGKAYIYNDNGILERIALYRNGVYAGDTPIEK